MIYLIGGTPRVGKTTLARMIMERKHVPFVPADALTHALDQTYPQLGIRSGEWADIPDKFFPFLKEFVRTSGWNLKDYTIEGDSFFPEHVKKLSEEFKIRSVFLGTSDTNLELIKGPATHDDWVSELSEEKQKEMPAWFMSISEMFKKESEKYQIPYLDVALGREQILESAYKELVA